MDVLMLIGGQRTETSQSKTLRMIFPTPAAWNLRGGVVSVNITGLVRPVSAVPAATLLFAGTVPDTLAEHLASTPPFVPSPPGQRGRRSGAMECENCCATTIVAGGRDDGPRAPPGIEVRDDGEDGRGHLVVSTEPPSGAAERQSLRRRPLLWVTKPHVEAPRACSAAATALLNGYGFEAPPAPRTVRPSGVAVRVGGVASTSVAVQERQARVRHLEGAADKVRKPMSKAYPAPAKPAPWNAGKFAATAAKAKTVPAPAPAPVQAAAGLAGRPVAGARKVGGKGKNGRSVGVQVDAAKEMPTGDAVQDFLQATAAFGGEALEPEGGKLSELCEGDKAKVGKLIRQVVELGQEVRRLRGEMASREGTKAELESRLAELGALQERQAEQHMALGKDNAKLRKKLGHTLELIRSYQARFESLDARPAHELPAGGPASNVLTQPPPAPSSPAPDAEPREVVLPTPEQSTAPLAQTADTTPPVSILTVRPDASEPSTAPPTRALWPRLPEEFYHQGTARATHYAPRTTAASGLGASGGRTDPSVMDALSRLSALLDSQHDGVPVGFRVENDSGEFASLGPAKPRVLKFDPNLGENGAFYFVDLDELNTPASSPPGNQPAPTATVPPRSPPLADGGMGDSGGHRVTHTTTTFSAVVHSKTNSPARPSPASASPGGRLRARAAWWEEEPRASPPQPAPSAPPIPAGSEHIFVPSTTAQLSPRGSAAERPRSPVQQLPAKRQLPATEVGDIATSEAPIGRLGGLAGEASFTTAPAASSTAGESSTIPAAVLPAGSGKSESGAAAAADQSSFSTIESAMPVTGLDPQLPRREANAARGLDHPYQLGIVQEPFADQMEQTSPTTASQSVSKLVGLVDTDQFAATGSTVNPVHKSLSPEKAALAKSPEGRSENPADLSDAVVGSAPTKVPSAEDALPSQGAAATSRGGSPVRAFSPVSAGPAMRYVTDLSGFDESLMDLVSEVESMDLGSPRSSLGALDAISLEISGKSRAAAVSTLRRGSGAAVGSSSPRIGDRSQVLPWPVAEQAPPAQQGPRVASWLRGSIYEENDIVSTIMDAEELGRSLLSSSSVALRVQSGETYSLDSTGNGDRRQRWD